eukprot:TRINITY_DN4092_c0_g1_i4.p1 TRINITY_DN4092_c0_g1~~TRINITY_DN4092_c0_g1_i4.p1  ORF type:complete len:115 (-),score=16.40 TRINITY_DN4092_c0_g1_i4:261-605(-)
MTSLQQLGFDKNSLTGSIPQTFQRLALLQSLFLQDNQLQGGLDSLVGLVNLKYGYLSRNQITGTIPTALGNIRTLQQLGMLCFVLLCTKIPPCFGNLKESIRIESVELFRQSLA